MTISQIQFTNLLILSVVFGALAILGQRMMTLTKVQHREAHAYLSSVAWV